MRAFDLRLGGGNASVRLRNDCQLQAPCRIEILQRRSLRFGGCRGSRERRPIVTIIQLHQQIACVDFLVIGDGDRSMKPATLGAMTVMSPPT